MSYALDGSLCACKRVENVMADLDISHDASLESLHDDSCRRAQRRTNDVLRHDAGLERLQSDDMYGGGCHGIEQRVIRNDNE